MSLQDAIRELEEAADLLEMFVLAKESVCCDPINPVPDEYKQRWLPKTRREHELVAYLRRAQQEQDALVAAAYRDEKQVKHMVDRFLGWRLPENFNPDGGISFEPLGNRGTEHEYKRQPVGTNVLDATQAEVMVRYMIDGMPSAVDARAALAAHDAEVRKEATSRVRVLLDNWIQLRDVKGDVTRLYAIGELENALNDLGQQASGKEEKS